ncbi:MAG TPA: Gfo/Idh/MocA family oxidoreductase [Ktedonobacterales bacterium]|nr:Gfo/Idh/MocA family oxidoreductase [Ktedonobacterales bacterium]
MINRATRERQQDREEPGNIRALLLVGGERAVDAQDVRALIASLQAGGGIAVSAAASASQLRMLDDFDTVIAYTFGGSLTDAQEQALVAFVRRGGGLVCLGETGEAWRDNAAIQDMLALGEGRRTQITEIIARCVPEHALTRRMDVTFAMLDSCYLPKDIPVDADPVLRVTWQFASAPLAYTRAYGQGSVFYTSLGVAPGALDHPALRQLIYRAVRYVAGEREAPTIGMAMLGYGAIGFEHGSAMRATPGLELRLVCDRNPARLETASAAFPGVRTTTRMDDVLADPEIGAVIIGTPPNTHARMARKALAAGKHVVVEKPFCITTAEADELIALAGERGLALTVYQNRRWDPDYLAIKRIIEEGTIGDVFHIETFIGGFSHPCDFWHSHEPVSGGVFYDWGSHYLDWVLTLLPGPVRDVRASSHKRVWHDVTNADQATLHIRFADGREATFIHSDVAALLKPKWYILGTKGAIVAHWRYETVNSRKWSGDLIEEKLAPAEALPAITVAVRASDGLISEQHLALPPMPVNAFHRNFADHLLTGEPLAIAAVSARRNIAVMEAAAYSAAHDAEVVRIDERYAYA